MSVGAIIHAEYQLMPTQVCAYHHRLSSPNYRLTVWLALNDLLPVNPDTAALIGASTGQRQTLWPLLVEKAVSSQCLRCFAPHAHYGRSTCKQWAVTRSTARAFTL